MPDFLPVRSELGMSTARAEGSGLVPVAAAQRRFDSRVYSPAQCVGQLAENSAAKGKEFNARNFWVNILPRFRGFTRVEGTDVGMPLESQALKVLDDGSGFGYEEVETMLSYGTPKDVPTDKKFGKFTDMPCTQHALFPTGTSSS